MAVFSIRPIMHRALVQWAVTTSTTSKLSTVGLSPLTARIQRSDIVRRGYCSFSTVCHCRRQRRKSCASGAILLSPVVDITMSRSSHSGSTDEDFLFRQLLDYKSYTYTYLLADKASNEAILIDPVIDTVERDLRVVQDWGLNLIYAANTHVHADHITGSGEIKKRVPTCKSMIAEVSQAKADVKLKAGDKIKFGKFELEARSTPGHTDGCMSFVWHEKGMVFTGDAVLIRGCGRTDFQQGSASSLYDSVHKQILSLPQNFKIFPAHDYTGQTMSTVGEELRFNPRLTRTKSEFVDIMNKLSLPYPKQIDKALPANMVCGVFDVSASATN